ncbi:MAG: DUF4274 domain-containing protein [Paludibacteraceae bacterium]|nr:DUF4274 domain-containing protein [Paludibacteraceae bacterium]
MSDLTKKQKKSIKKVLRGASAKGLNDPIEKHQLLLHWNFDDGIEPFNYFVESKDTDLGTIVLLYWMLGAGFLCEESELRDYEKEFYELIKKIEENVKVDFYENQNISVDPKNVDGTDYLDECICDELLNKIPKELTRATPGELVERADLAAESVYKIYPPTEKDIEKLNKKIEKGFELLSPQVNRDSDPKDIIKVIDEYSKNKRPQKGASKKFSREERNKFGLLDLVLGEQFVRMQKWLWFIREIHEQVIDSREFILVSADNRYTVGLYAFSVEKYSDRNYSDGVDVLSGVKVLSDIDAYTKKEKAEQLKFCREYYNYGDISDEETEEKEVERVLARLKETPFYKEKIEGLTDKEIVEKFSVEIERRIYNHNLCPDGVGRLTDETAKSLSAGYVSR